MAVSRFVPIMPDVTINMYLVAQILESTGCGFLKAKIIPEELRNCIGRMQCLRIDAQCGLLPSCVFATAAIACPIEYLEEMRER